MEAIGDFLKNLSLLDLLVIFVTGILILAGILILVFGRSRRSVYGLLGAALLPLLLGLFSMFLKNYHLDKGTYFLHPSPEWIEAARQEGVIIAFVGGAGTSILILMGLCSLALKRGGKT